MRIKRIAEIMVICVIVVFSLTGVNAAIDGKVGLIYLIVVVLKLKV